MLRHCVHTFVIMFSTKVQCLAQPHIIMALAEQCFLLSFATQTKQSTDLLICSRPKAAWSGSRPPCTNRLLPIWSTTGCRAKNLRECM